LTFGHQSIFKILIGTTTTVDSIGKETYGKKFEEDRAIFFTIRQSLKFGVEDNEQNQKTCKKGQQEKDVMKEMILKHQNMRNKLIEINS